MGEREKIFPVAYYYKHIQHTRILQQRSSFFFLLSGCPQSVTLLCSALLCSALLGHFPGKKILHSGWVERETEERFIRRKREGREGGREMTWCPLAFPIITTSGGSRSRYCWRCFWRWCCCYCCCCSMLSDCSCDPGGDLPRPLLIPGKQQQQNKTFFSDSEIWESALCPIS